MSMSIRYQKGKRNVIKRSVGFADWFVKFRRNSKFAPKTFLKKLVPEKRRDTSAWKLLATGYWRLTRFIADTSRSKRRVRPWAMIVLINYT